MITFIRASSSTLVAACIFAVAFTAPAVASGPAPTRAQAQYEIRFMTEMIDHHAMAIEMGELCLTRAIHRELLELCQQIIATQSQEIATMQSWLEDWYGVDYEPRMTTGMQRQLERMASMTGAEFEIAFMKSMIRHHWKAVVRASGCIDRAYHEELVEMCTQIVQAQVAEISQMRAWLCEWYGVCNYGPKGAVARAH